MVRDVLVFTPVYRLEPATIAAVFALEWEGPLSFLLQRDNPGGGGKADHLHQYERGRRTFLDGPWDAMLVIESDIVPPVDALQKLAALDVDCAYGVYTFRGDGRRTVNVFERYPGNPRNEGESLSLHPQKLADARAAGTVRMSGGGLGCVLIKRHVLEAVPFRYEGEGGGHCDTYFNRDVMRSGAVQMADMTLKCGHVDVDGTTLWPS